MMMMMMMMMMMGFYCLFKTPPLHHHTAIAVSVSSFLCLGPSSLVRRLRGQRPAIARRLRSPSSWAPPVACRRLLWVSPRPPGLEQVAKWLVATTDPSSGPSNAGRSARMLLVPPCHPARWTRWWSLRFIGGGPPSVVGAMGSRGAHMSMSCQPVSLALLRRSISVAYFMSVCQYCSQACLGCL